MDGNHPQIRKGLSIRVPPNSYVGAAFFLLFLSAFLIYVDQLLIGALMLALVLLAIPVLAVFDRIRFDGRILRRTGPMPFLFDRLTGTRKRLRINHIEQIDTQAIRSYKRKGQLAYAYRTSIRGRGINLTFSSGGYRYLKMVKALFPLVPEDALDNRSIEIRDYLTERHKVLRDARSSNIPSAEVLESSLQQVRKGRGLLRAPVRKAADDDRAEDLRRLANQLRVSGAMLQAVEAFRRAVTIKPADGWILFEFAKCLYSFAGSERDDRLERRAVAMLRLAERRAGNDPELLSRLGESYFQIGEWRRSGAAFRRVVDRCGERFRALRGLAELALREGKIAHVIHNFSAAGRSVETAALKRWTNGEVEYFSRLNSDDEYMELEISRVNLIDTLSRARRTSLKLTAIGLPVIAAGVLIPDDLIANIGWAVSGISIVLWAALNLLGKMLETRIPFDLVDSDK